MTKLDELESYLRELRAIAPRNFEEFQRIEIRRGCERLLQIAIECVINICSLFVSGLRLSPIPVRIRETYLGRQTTGKD
ncbi:MAG: hypothetical protein HYY85_17350 [Deltaproteobacteria bacterium]|nr:hypothetical protein [Deltaproteobacteria bacterium]